MYRDYFETDLEHEADDDDLDEINDVKSIAEEG